MEGEVILIDVPPGNGNMKFRVPGKGMPIMNTNVKGDLFVTLMLDVPTERTPGYDVLIEQLAEYEEKSPGPRSKAFKDTVKGL
jgi:DnaJ-class molecular chaperone